MAMVSGVEQVWKKVSARTNTNKEKSTALTRFVIVCKGGVAKTPLPKGSGKMSHLAADLERICTLLFLGEMATLQIEIPREAKGK